MKINRTERKCQSYFIIDSYSTEPINNMEDVIEVFNTLEAENKKIGAISIQFDEDHSNIGPSDNFKSLEEIKSDDSVKTIDINEIDFIQFIVCVNKMSNRAHLYPSEQRLTIFGIDEELYARAVAKIENDKNKDHKFTKEETDKMRKAYKARLKRREDKIRYQTRRQAVLSQWRRRFHSRRSGG